MRPLLDRGVTTAFSWGYRGWGNHTRELVKLVDAVERGRGFEPPVFVDVRLRRAVRAIGFRDRAFEELLGKRYVWLPQLGNRAIADPRLEMQLAEPAAIEELAKLANAKQRRVIFFCSCASPEARHTCHRGLVVDELVRTAKLTVQEWPGAAPVIATGIAAEARGKSLLLPERVDLGAVGALPHYSIVQLPSAAIVASPAVRTTRGWVLPIHRSAPKLSEELRAWCDEQRAVHELEAFGVQPRERRWREIEL
jgi:hypothetical protein